MRKKLLALLMCATMVLGSSAVAFAADVTPTDVTNAQTIINQYDGSKGAVEYEYDAKTSTITFNTTYTKGSDKVLYTYAFVGADKNNTYNSATSYVRTSEDGKSAYTLTNGNAIKITASSDTRKALVIELDTDKTVSSTSALTNPSVTATALNGAVLKGLQKDAYYYATAEVKPAGTVLDDGQYVVTTEEADLNNGDVISLSDGSALACAGTVVTLTSFTPSNTGSIIGGTETSNVNDYGLDESGYISKKDTTTTDKLLKYSSAIADGYWVNISKAKNKQYDIAQALANGEISKNAVAVKIDFYKLASDDDKSVAGGTEKGFKKLTIADFNDKNDIEVTFKTDWLSRSNAKNANTVYLLNDTESNKYANYFYNFGKVLKVSDLADEAFTTKYVVSGTYIFDYNEDASQNDGVSDTDTTATTTAASQTAATSPKTGDVAPIAALAVVMMGACGAMVVASKKRA
jgi:hypothetical protein